MKAIGLLSGGLDSTLAAWILIEQGIEVEALKFTSPFCNCDHGGKCFSAEAAKELGIKLMTIAKGEDYLSIIRNPKHGYGSGMNPCIDCRIYMLIKARKYAEESGAAFVFTGEVLGQRPMSQHREALRMIEKESGLVGKLLRPLSAQYLEETDAEKSGYVDRSKLLSISGRSRKPQYELAKTYDIRNFACPAGGCLLTETRFASRLRDHFARNKSFTSGDVILLKHGRYFAYGEYRIIVGRNEKENGILQAHARSGDFVLKTIDVNGPIAILSGDNIEDSTIKYAAELVASYCDVIDGKVRISYSVNNIENLIEPEYRDKSFFAETII